MKISTFTLARSIAFVFALAIFLSTFASCKRVDNPGTPANTVAASLKAPSGTTTCKPAGAIGIDYAISRSCPLEAIYTRPCDLYPGYISPVGTFTVAAVNTINRMNRILVRTSPSRTIHAIHAINTMNSAALVFSMSFPANAPPHFHIV